MRNKRQLGASRSGARRRPASSQKRQTALWADVKVGRRPLPLFGRIDRYVLMHFVQSYMTAMLLMTGLFMVIDMASNLDDYLSLIHI